MTSPESGSESLTSSERKIMELLDSIQERLDRLEQGGNQQQLTRSSVEDGSINFYDSNGALRKRSGKQIDQRFAELYANGEAPPTPTAPEAIGIELGIVVRWHGTFVDAKLPTDFARLDVHVSETSDFTPDGSTIMGSMVAEGSIGFPSDANLKYVKLVAVTNADVPSLPSAQISVQPQAASNIAAGSITADQLAANLIVASRLASTNYVEGESGWELEGETGSAEFNDVNMRGQIIAESTENTDIILKFGIDAAGQASLFWISRSSGVILGQFYIGSGHAKPAMTLAEGSFHYQLWIMEQGIGFVDDWNGAVYFKSRNHGTEQAFLHAGTNDSFDGTPDIEDWHDLSFNNGATARSGHRAQYKKMADGTVVFTGQVGNLPGSFTLFATLPSDYWPPETVDIAIAVDHAGGRTYTAGRLQVQTDGQMVYVDQDPNGAPGWISLEGASYSLI